jgi:hypothetical protein
MDDVERGGVAGLRVYAVIAVAGGVLWVREYGASDQGAELSKEPNGTNEHQ